MLHNVLRPIRRAFEAATHIMLAAVSAAQIFFRILALKRKLRAGSPPQRLLIIGLVQHIGDIVSAEPVARQLRSQHPDDFLLWCARAPYRELIENFPAVDAVLPVHCLTAWIFLRALAPWDNHVDLHVNGQACSVCAIPIRKTEDRSGVTALNYFDFGSLTDIYARIAGVNLTSSQPTLPIPNATADACARLKLPSRYVVAHARSEQAIKNWKPESWDELAQQIWAEFQIPIVEIGLHRTITNGQVVNLCGRLTLLETAEVIRQSALFIGLDSGPAHIANAVETFGVLLLGDYFVFKNYYPFGGRYGTRENCAVVRAESVRAIPVDSVFSEVRARLV